jgi:guanosine-3',5'-bis(diphosphate) 3'-pyrophosphohydrolase
MIPIKYLQSLKIAAETAMEAHKGQTRKYNDAPYVVHPARVAQLVLVYDNSAYKGAIIAWLHDILEDCGDKGRELVINSLTNMPLSYESKTEILTSIEALTKNDTIHPRQAKWDDCIIRIIKDDHDFTKLVKICDRIDNLMDMVGFTKEFIKMYLAETQQLIDALDTNNLSVAEDEALDTLIKITNKMMKELEPQSF